MLISSRTLTRCVAAVAMAAASAVAGAQETEGVARVGGCGPAGCGPMGIHPGVCGPNGCAPAGAGVCGPYGCITGGMGSCPGYGGAPCYAANGSCLGSDALCGRPYTFGDLHCDMRSMNGHVCESVGLSDGDDCPEPGLLHSWWMNECHKHKCRRAYSRQVWAAHLNNKFNYFHPQGCGGAGCPPFGCYTRVYAASPGYADARDSRVFAAPATGVPTAVPLPPGVRHQYNYSWGTPGSRLTPISNFVRP